MFEVARRAVWEHDAGLVVQQTAWWQVPGKQHTCHCCGVELEVPNADRPRYQLEVTAFGLGSQQGNVAIHFAELEQPHSEPDSLPKEVLSLDPFAMHRNPQEPQRERPQESRSPLFGREPSSKPKAPSFCSQELRSTLQQQLLAFRQHCVSQCLYHCSARVVSSRCSAMQSTEIQRPQALASDRYAGLPSVAPRHRWGTPCASSLK